MSRAGLKALMTSNILTGGRRTSAANMRQLISAIIDEVLNIPDDITSAPGIIAFATGGQINATILTNKVSRIDTCLTDLDSVKFIAAIEDKSQSIFNATSNSSNVYPAVGGRFRTEDGLLAINAPVVLGSANQLTVYCLKGEPGVYTKI